MSILLLTEEIYVIILDEFAANYLKTLAFPAFLYDKAKQETCYEKYSFPYNVTAFCNRQCFC
jgi:hypothetical protein